MSSTSPFASLRITAESSPSSPFNAAIWPMPQIHPPGGDMFAHRFDRMRRGAEFIAPMNQRQMFCDGLKIESPVERRIAAADDHDVFAAKLLDLAHRVEDRLALIGFDPLDRRLLRLERAAACGDDHRLAREGLAAADADAERRRLGASRAPETLDHFAEVEGRMKRLDLLEE